MFILAIVFAVEQTDGTGQMWSVGITERSGHGVGGSKARATPWSGSSFPFSWAERERPRARPFFLFHCGIIVGCRISNLRTDPHNLPRVITWITVLIACLESWQSVVSCLRVV